MRVTHATTATGSASTRGRVDAPKWNADHVITGQPWVSPTDYGAVGNGLTDDTTAVQSALTAACASGGGGVVLFPEGTYLVSASTTGAILLTLTRGIRLVGVGGGRSVIKVADSMRPYLAIVGGSPSTVDLTGLEVCGLTFDHNVTNNAIGTAAAITADPAVSILVYAGTDIAIHHNQIINASSLNNLVVNGTTCARVQVTDNVGSVLGDDPDLVVHDASIVYVHADDVVISRNVLVSAGQNSGGATTAIEVHGSHVVVADNVLTDWEVGINATGVDTKDNRGIVVSGNTITGGNFGIVLYSQPYLTHTTGYGLDGVTVDGNVILLAGSDVWAKNTAHSEGGIVVAAGSTDLDITGLTITNNVVTHPLEASPVTNNSASLGIGWYSSSLSTLSHSRIGDNLVLNFPMAGIRLSCQINDVAVTGNTLRNCGSTLDPTFTSTSAYRMPIFIGGTSLVGLRISDNLFRDSISSALRPAYFVYLFQGGSSSGSGIEIIDNSFLSTGTALTAQVFMDNSAGTLQPLLIGAIPDFTHLTGSQQQFALGSQVIDTTTGTRWTVQADQFTWREWAFAFPLTKTPVYVPRLYSSGTPILTTDVATSGWGAGASVAVGGTDMSPIVLVTAGTGPSANPTVTLTWHDGTYLSAPTTIATMTGGSGAFAFVACSAVAGSMILTYVGTPVNAATYQLQTLVVGHG